MKNTYIYDAEKNILRICGNPIWSKPNTAVRDFCEDYNIKLENFNLPVEIDSSVVYCNELFKDCRHFNQKVVIPDGVKNCTRMFYHCESFNQPVMLPESIEAVYDMFYDCKAFNQEIKIPDCVSNSSGMFMGCESLNQPIQLLSTGQCCCEDIFVGCSSLLPENVTIYSRKISGKETSENVGYRENN